MLDVRVDWDYRRDAQGQVNGIIAVLADITAQLRLEEQYRQAQKMESVGRLAGGVAHDFNNMLGVIIGHAELAMLQLHPSDALYRDLQEIQTAAQRSADLTRQLLGFARKQTAMPKVLDLNDTVAGMLKMLRRLIGEDIDLAWAPGHDLWRVKIDPSQIDQILANLAANARDAIGGRGQGDPGDGQRRAGRGRTAPRIPGMGHAGRVRAADGERHGRRDDPGRAGAPL